MLRYPSRERSERLRDFFEKANYSLPGLQTTLIAGELTSRRLRNLPRLLHCTQEHTLLNTLIRLFAIGVPVESKIVEDLMPPWVLEACLEAGLISFEGNGIKPNVALTPFEQFLVATDLPLTIEAAERPDVVLGINPTSWLLSRFTVRKRVKSLMDFGAGCGVQALVASSHCERVTATDLNPRATAFSAFNARFNGIETIECLTGDSFEPVKGRTFDLIVANPPFFVSPSNDHMFCDNSMELDLFCRSLVRQAPEYLNDGGFFQMVLEWVELRDQPWQERLSEWLAGTGFDAWILRAYSQDPGQYAEQRIRETTMVSAGEDEARFAQWVAYYRERNVRAIHGGLITMRRRSGPNWIRIDDLPHRMAEPFGESILEGFDARDFLGFHTADDQLLEIRPKLSTHAELIRRHGVSANGWTAPFYSLRLTKGIPFSQAVQPLVAEFAGRCDGTRTLRELIDDFSMQVNVDASLVKSESLAIMRKLIECGFVQPHSGPS